MIEVVCAVIVDDGRVLICRRPNGAHLAGDWEFPGGKVEEGEEERTALEREIHEELGCRVEVNEALAVVDHSYPEVTIRLRGFLCRVTAGEPAALEHEEIGWFEAAEVETLGLADADRLMWGKVRRGANLTECETSSAGAGSPAVSVLRITD